MEIAPELVRKETRIKDFVRREDGDTAKAAVRLAKCWKVRKKAFGERWLLPMTQTGVGALRPYDVSIIRSGVCKTVQSPVHGTVIIIDTNLLPRGEPHSQPEVVFTSCQRVGHAMSLCYI